MHPGAIALARRLRGIPNLEKRRETLRQFAECLVQLEDEILEQQKASLGHNGGPVLEEGAPAPVPFERKPAAA